MAHPRRSVALLAAAVMALLLVAAAPSSADRNDPLPPDLRAWVDEHGPVRVGWTDVAPLSMADENGQITRGWVHDVTALWSLKLGVTVEHVVFDSIAEKVEALRAGEIDIAGLTGHRPDITEFAVPMDPPLAWEPIVLLTTPERASEPIGGLVGRTVSAIPGSPMEQLLLERFPDADHVATASPRDAVRAVAEGRLEYYVGPLPVAGWFAQQLQAEITPVGEPLAIAETASWAVPGTPAEQLMQLGRATISDQELSVIQVQWTGFDMGNPQAERPEWLVPASLVVLGGMLALGLVNVVLRRRVAAATAELRELNTALEQRVAERTGELAHANRRLVRNNDALTKFAHTAAHDLRGPVTAIGGLAQLAARPDFDPTRRASALEAIQRSSRRLGDLVDSLLADAIEAGGIAPEAGSSEFAEWLVEAMGAEAEVAGAQVVVRTGDHARVPVDDAVLRSAAINLVGNAVKYATNPAGTRIEVELSPTADGWWVLTVDDNGPGIPPDRRAQVFTRGFRDVGATDERGIGLGLAATRDRVRDAGGDVILEPSPLGGARFVVRLAPHLPTAEGETAEGDTSEGADSETTTTA